MNEQIKQLYAATCLGAGNLSEEDFCEKFAELIVEKCADFIEEDQGSGKELSDRMKQHFRVE